MTTTREVALDAPMAAYKAPTSYSEIIRDEVKAECGRRGISQRRLALGLGLAQQSISERWRGKVPWTLDEVERLESVLGLTRGALLFRCARRDSNPQPSDLSPLQVLFAGLWRDDDECDFCQRGMSDCVCDEDYNPWELLVGLPVFRTSASAGCFECLELGCGGELAWTAAATTTTSSWSAGVRTWSASRSRRPNCRPAGASSLGTAASVDCARGAQCTCWDYEYDDVATTAATAWELAA